MNNIKISVIITTYNWPEALRTVLRAFSSQTNQDFEIIIADDGSTEKTRLLISEMQKKMSVPIHHVYQPDQGFRASAIRNKASLKAQGETLLFIDGDCVPPPNFIEAHLALRKPGFFVAGNRILLSQAFTIKVLSEDLRIETWGLLRWILARLKGHCNRILPWLRLPMGPLRYLSPERWRGAMGCHLALWRQDLFKVNGWEEEYEGWGFEDSDLVIRLIHSGVKRIEARFFVPLIHLWHPVRSRDNVEKNWARLKQRQTIEACDPLAKKGLNQYSGVPEPSDIGTKALPVTNIEGAAC